MKERGITLKSVSEIWRTAPVPPDPLQPFYSNAVCAVDTKKNPHDLLMTLLDIETGFGRVRSVLNAPRVIDLDLLAYRDLQIDDPSKLILPHPRLHERAFVLYPLKQIAPQWVHPVSGKTVDEMIDALPKDQRAETQ